MIKKEPVFSIIIPTCNRPDLLKKVLSCVSPERQQIEGNSVEYEIIVTDDGDDKGSRTLVEKEFPHVTYAEGPQKGPACNRNHGASLAKGEWLLFTDDDCLPSEDWVATYFGNVDADHAVLEGKTIADRPKRRLNEGAPINETGGLLWSCNFAIRKSTFQQLQGFDESFPFAAMEDVDFRERLVKAGHTTKFVDSAVVVHPMAPYKGLQNWKNSHQSWLYLMKKHPHLLNKNIPWSLLHSGLHSMLKRTFPGLFKYKGRGFIFSLTRDLFMIFLGIKYLFLNP